MGALYPLWPFQQARRLAGEPIFAQSRTGSPLPGPLARQNAPAGLGYSPPSQTPILSMSSGIQIPPITVRVCMPLVTPSVASYQSESGTRLGYGQRRCSSGSHVCSPAPSASIATLRARSELVLADSLMCSTEAIVSTTAAAWPLTPSATDCDASPISLAVCLSCTACSCRFGTGRLRYWWTVIGRTPRFDFNRRNTRCDHGQGECTIGVSRRGQ